LIRLSVASSAVSGRDASNQAAAETRTPMASSHGQARLLTEGEHFGQFI
jgi:hypothetical protein